MDRVLYTYFRSSAAYRVRIAMNLKGLEARHVFVLATGLLCAMGARCR